MKIEFFPNTPAKSGGNDADDRPTRALRQEDLPPGVRMIQPSAEEDGDEDEAEVRGIPEPPTGGFNFGGKATREDQPAREDEEDDEPEEEEEEAPTARAEDEDSEGEEEEEDDVNVHYFVARDLKEKGVLPADVEIPEDIEYSQVLDMYADHMRKVAPAKAIETLTSELRDQGYNEQDILFSRAYRSGVDPSSFAPAERMRAAAEANLRELSPEDQREVIRLKYELRGLSPREQQSLVAAVSDEDLAAAAAEAQDYHRQGWQNWEQEARQRAEAQEQAKRERDNTTLRKLNQILTTRRIGEQEYPAEQIETLRKDLYEQNATLEVDGRQYSTTKVTKFLYEFQQDPELQLRLYLMTTYPQEVKETARNQAISELEEAMSRKYKKNKGKQRSKATTGGRKNGSVFVF